MDITVWENEFRPLIDRDKGVADAKRAFSQQLKVIGDVVNYGTNLLPRCYGSSEKKLKDIVVIGILLHQVIAMLDAVELLISNAAIHAAGPQARAIFEASVYIDWILQSEPETKATYYYVHNMRRQRRWALRLNARSPEATAFVSEMPDLAAFRQPAVVQQAASTLAEVDRILSQPTFAAVNAAFDNCRARNPKWYQPLGPKNLGVLARAVGRFPEYTVMYSKWSETMHSANYAQHIKVGQGTVTFEPIRHLVHFEELFRFSMSFAIHAFHAVLAEYRSSELAVFGRKYGEKWREAFLNIPKLKYEVSSVGPAS